MKRPNIMKANVLIADGDLEFQKQLRISLEENEFNVDVASSGKQTLLWLNESLPHILLLERDLPDMPGLDICREILKQHWNVGAIMLTAHGTEEDLIHALNTGADDYVVKPFSTPGLIARMNALIRSRHPMFAKRLEVGDVVLDWETAITRGDWEIKLGRLETKLLAYFMANPKTTLSREQILENVYGLDTDNEVRTVDSLVRRVRTAFKDPTRPDPFEPVEGVGYRFDPR